MAVKQEVIALLVFCGLIQCTGCICNVTCTTDFISSLNCSNSGSATDTPFQVEADCRDDEEQVHGSCEIRPSHCWCTIEPDNFESIIAYNTNCTVSVKHASKHKMETYELYRLIKPQPPFNLSLTESDDDYNLTWHMAYTEDQNIYLNNYLIYKVRLRTNSDSVKEPNYYTVGEDRRYLAIPTRDLQQGREYVVDVQAQVNPGRFPSTWSEWSSTKTIKRGKMYIPESDTDLMGWWFCLLLVFPIVLMAHYLVKMLFQYVPNPEDFFKPLYHTYEGDFKKWVGPVFTFSNCDLLEKSVPLQVMSEKQLEARGQQGDGMEEHSSNSGSSGQGEWSLDSRSLLSLSNHIPSRLYFLGGSSQGATHSSGHISIDTVTVSVEEGAVLDWSGETGKGRQSVEDLFNYPGNSQGEGLVCQLGSPGGEGGAGGGSSENLYNMDWQLRAQDMEIEQISLDSFSSNEHSEDGYPRVGLDLDTIDSGFLESDCSSPVNSEFDGGEQIDAALLGCAGGSHSNYVKQWEACTTVQGDTCSSGQQSMSSQHSS